MCDGEGRRCNNNRRRRIEFLNADEEVFPPQQSHANCASLLHYPMQRKCWMQIKTSPRASAGGDVVVDEPRCRKVFSQWGKWVVKEGKC